MRGLGRGVDDQFDVLAAFGEDRVDGLPIANIGVAVSVVIESLLQLLAVPGGGAVLAEEVLAHIVVDADDVEAFFVKEFGGLAADESGRASDEGDAQGVFPLR